MRRLFWRAGFGATRRPDPACGRGAARTRRSTTCSTPTAAILRGRAPADYGRALDPLNEFGHDKLWWLDRMVRTDRPLQEKMTLFWHDHFATQLAADAR